MIKSMTGFGSYTQSINNISITSEVKTLNSKFLDLSLKIPKSLSSKEIEIRNLISEHLVRGKVSFSIQIDTEPSSDNFVINKDLFKEYYDYYLSLEKETGKTFTDILKLCLDSPGVQNTQEDSFDDKLWQNVQSNIVNTLSQCTESRITEGTKLGKVLLQYINSISTSLDSIIEIEPHRLNQIRERLKSDINDLISSSEYDHDRLEQELIYYSEKLDINEEIERLKIHLNSYKETIKDNLSQHGKKLGFISQEIGREINTIGSKANSAEIQKYVILMKEELEKIKEQTQNVL